MAKLPTKQSIDRQPLPGPGRAGGVNVPTPNVNTGGNRSAPLNLDIMDESVIPNLETPNFDRERRQIASSKVSAAASIKGGFDDIARETLKFKAEIDDERNKQDELAYLTALAQYDRGMTETVAALRNSNAPSHVWGGAVQDAEKQLAEQVFKDNNIPPHLREKAELAIFEKNTRYNNTASTEARDRQLEEEKARLLVNVDNYAQILIKDPTPEAKADAMLDMKAVLQAGVDHNIISQERALQIWKDKGAGSVEDMARIEASTNAESFLKRLDGEPAARNAMYGLGGNESAGPDAWDTQNTLLYLGRSQFGADRLKDLGFYEHGPGETKGKWWQLPNNKKWTGKWTFPGAGKDGGDLVLYGQEGKAYFLSNPEAQEAAEDAHFARMRQDIEKNGWDKRVGETVNGVRVTRTGLYMAMHLGGVAGTRAWFGGENRRDVYGTSITKYMKQGQLHFLLDQADPKVVESLRSQVTTKLLNDLNTYGSGIAGGDPVDPTEIERVKSLADSTYDKGLIAKAKQLEELNNFVVDARQKTPAQLRREQSALRSQMVAHGSGGSEQQRKLDAHLTATINKLNKDLDTNVLDTAEATGAIPPVQPIDFSSKESMDNHLSLVFMAAAHYGRQPKDFLTEQQKTDLLSTFQDAPTSQKAAVVDSLVKSWGPWAGAVANQVTDSNPVIANVIQLRANNQIMPADLTAVLSHLPDTVTGAEGEGEQRKFSITDNYDFKNATIDVMGNSLAFTGEGVIETRIKKTAEILYAVEARKQNIAEGPVNAKLWKKFLQKAAGQVNGKGGFGSYNGETVLLPAHMDTYDIDSAVDTITMDNISKFSREGATIPVWINRRTGEIGTLDDDDLQDAHLVTVGPGQYALTLHDPEDPNREFFLRADDPSKAFILNLNDFDMDNLREEAMRKRNEKLGQYGPNIIPDNEIPGLFE